MKSDENVRSEEREREREGQRVEGGYRGHERKRWSTREMSRSSVAVWVNDHYVGERVICLWLETNK